jgi:hypothetical protein
VVAERSVTDGAKVYLGAEKDSRLLKVILNSKSQTHVWFAPSFLSARPLARNRLQASGFRLQVHQSRKSNEFQRNQNQISNDNGFDFDFAF